MFITALCCHLAGVLFKEVLLGFGFYLEFLALLLYAGAGHERRP